MRVLSPLNWPSSPLIVQSTTPSRSASLRSLHNVGASLDRPLIGYDNQFSSFGHVSRTASCRPLAVGPWLAGPCFSFSEQGVSS